MSRQTQFFVVTACRDAGHFIDDTVTSVATQSGDFALHYHVQDGASSDDTGARLDAWADRLAGPGWPRLCRELRFTHEERPDDGLYDALGRAFTRAPEGRDAILGWINAGDRLAPGALQTVAAVFDAIPALEWLNGPLAQLNEAGSIVSLGAPRAAAQKTVAAGLHDGRHFGYIQQEGTFWRHSLWQKAGGFDAGLRVAGDFALWRRFAEHAPLARVGSPIGLFRRHRDRLGGDGRLYGAEVASLLAGAAADRRDAMWADFRRLAEAGDREALRTEGYWGPLVEWDAGRETWIAKVGLQALPQRAHAPSVR